MDEARARELFTAARVAVLSTVDESGRPHLVPVTFVVERSTLWTATDAKPKTATWLRRHANLAGQPRVSLLVQHWDEDWSSLWWVRADGVGRVITEAPAAIELLRAKYPQYEQVAVGPPVIEVTVDSWHGWTA